MNAEYKAILIAILVMIPFFYVQDTNPKKWKSDDYWVPPLMFAVCLVVIFVSLIVAVIRW